MVTCMTALKEAIRDRMQFSSDSGSRSNENATDTRRTTRKPHSNKFIFFVSFATYGDIAPHNFHPLLPKNLAAAAS